MTTVFNFKDLTSFTADDLIKTIPLSRAVEVTIDAYKAEEAPDFEMYKTWATFLFQQYGPARISNSDLNKLLDFFSSAIKELLNECQEHISETHNYKLTTFLTCSSELFTWIRSVATELDTNEITVFLCFGLSVINNYLAVFSNQINRLFVSKFVEKSVALQALILSILSENPGKFHFNYNRACLIRNLISHLCSVGELTPKLDIKTTIETWKCITRLTSNSAAPGQSVDCIVWLKRPMSFLTNEIGRNVQTVYRKNSISEPIHQIQKFLKVTNFYLKLLQKLTTDSRHIPFPVCEDFLNAFAVIFTPPAYVVNTPVHKEVVEYITKSFTEVIPWAYRNKLFFELLLKESGNIKTNDAFYEILFEVIELAIRRNETEYINPQLLDVAFQRSTKCVKMFLSASTYNRFIELFSSLHTHFYSEEFERTLINSVLQDDIVLALTAIDIWCTIVGISSHSTRLTYFKFWRNINEGFVKFSNRLPALYVEVLLRNIYMLLSAEEKDSICDNFNAYVLTSDRFLLTIGLHAISDNTTKAFTINHSINELTRFLKESSSNMAVDHFYMIVRNLKLLAPIAFRNDEIIEMLLRYLEIAMQNKKFILLVESILDYIASKLDFIDDSKVLKILTDVSMELSMFEDHPAKLCLVRFLKRTLRNPRLEKHSEEILKIVESDELTKYLGNIESPTNEGGNPEANEKLLEEILKKRSMEEIVRMHVCPAEEEEEEVHVRKKMKTVTNFLLESLEKSVDELQSKIQLDKLSSSNKELIKRVVNKLQVIDMLS